MKIEGNHRTWQIEDEEALEKILAFRDERGGAQFWLSPTNAEWPCLAIRISGNHGDVHYFPTERHAGFRRLSGQGLSDGGFTKLEFDGCDPSDGEESPNAFILSFQQIVDIARNFFCSGTILDFEKWLAL